MEAAFQAIICQDFTDLADYAQGNAAKDFPDVRSCRLSLPLTSPQQINISRNAANVPRLKFYVFWPLTHSRQILCPKWVPANIPGYNLLDNLPV
jgi:hypothetical protein